MTTLGMDGIVAVDTPVSIGFVLAWVVGGLGLFLYGIDLMTTSLRHAAGGTLRRVFESATRTRFHGLLAGTGVTALFQSSSATTVMVVGFVNAGLLRLEHAVGLVLGANIGGTITSQITAYKFDDLVLPLIGAGFLVSVLPRRRGARRAGESLVGLGIMLFGLWIMKQAVSGYQDTFHGWLTVGASHGRSGLLLAFLASLVATAIIQSSAATIVMLQALYGHGAFGDPALLVPLVLGAHLGTCITAVLASLKTSRAARRAAVAHVLFNVFGAVLGMALLPFYAWLIPQTAATPAHQVANLHLVMKLVDVAVFLPFTRPFTRLLVRLMPGRDEITAIPEFIRYDLLARPEAALDATRKEVARMLAMALDVLKRATRGLLERSDLAAERVMRDEDTLDDLYEAINEYLVAIGRGENAPAVRMQPSLLFHIVSDVERIGDHAENLAELGGLYRATGQTFSATAVGATESLLARVIDMGGRALHVFGGEPGWQAADVTHDLRAVNAAVSAMLDDHARRLQEGTCHPLLGIVFTELVMTLQRTARHLGNIAATATTHMPAETLQRERIRREMMEHGGAARPEAG